MKILGIDLGTNSLGWAIRELPDGTDAEQYWHEQINGLGTTVFTKPTDPQSDSDESLAVGRRLHRMPRRRFIRKRRRKQQALKFLVQQELCPLSMEEWQAWAKPKKGERPVYPSSEAFRNWLKLDFDGDGQVDVDPRLGVFELRAKAYTDPKTLTPYELGRVFYHLAQKRGYQSSRQEEAIFEEADTENPDDKTAEELGKVKGAIEQTNQELVQYGTIGNMVCQKLRKGEIQRARRVSALDDYTDKARDHYRDEFRKILEKQTDDPQAEKWDYLEHILFDQRPLKSQKHSVGKCPFEPKKFCCPLSHPAYERFRALQIVNNIKLTSENHRLLDEAEKNTLLETAFVRASTFDGEGLRKKLEKQLGTKNLEINYRDTQTLPGAPTLYALKTALGSWEKVEALFQKWHARDLNARKVGNTGPDIHELWQWVFDADLPEKQQQCLAKLQEHFGIDEEAGSKLLKAVKPGYANLSLKAIRSINTFLSNGHTYSEAVLFAKVPQLVGTASWEKSEAEVIDAFYDRMENIIRERQIVNIANDWVLAYNNLPPEERYAMGPYEWDEEDHAELEKRIATRTRLSKSEVRQRAKEVAEKLKPMLATGSKDYKPEYSSIHSFPLFKQPPRTREALIEILKEHFPDVADKKWAKIYHHSEIEEFTDFFDKETGQKLLPPAKTNSLRNPVVVRSLTQLRKLCNHLLKKGIIDENTRVIVEMARDLNTKNMRLALDQVRKKNEDRRKDAWKEIEKTAKKNNIPLAESTKDRLILKYLLWEDQGKECLYTGKPIQLSELIATNSPFDIEHTIPQSRFPDSERENLTIADKNFNRNTKGDTFPADLANYAEVEPRLKVFKKNIKQLEKTIKSKKFASKKAADKKSKDAAVKARLVAEMEQQYWRDKLKTFTTKEEDYKNGFRKRQMRDTHMINKYALKLLKTTFKRVRGGNGSVTALARRALNIEEKTRDFHYHHAVDAALQTFLYPCRGSIDMGKIIAEAKRGEGPHFRRMMSEKRDERDDDRLVERYVRKHWQNPYRKEHPSFLNAALDELAEQIVTVHADWQSPFKQTKKKIRDEQGKPTGRFQEGQGIRAQLHKATPLGKIKNPKDGKDAYRKSVWVKNIILKGSEQGKVKAESIVDEKLREATIAALQNDKKLFEKQEYLDFNGQKVYKVKVFVRSTSPLKVKAHQNTLGYSDKRPRSDHQYDKEHLYYDNGDNLAALICKKNSKKWGLEILPIQAMEAARAMVDGQVDWDGLAEGREVRAVLKKGDLVMFYENHPKELEKAWGDHKELKKRIFQVTFIEAKERKVYFKRSDCGMNKEGLKQYFRKKFKGDSFPDKWFNVWH